MTITHQEARTLLQRSMEVQLRRDEAAALDAHLAGCEPCQAYSRNLGRLHQRLAISLPARWMDHAPASRQVEQNFQNIESRVRRRQMRQRFLAVAQPVLGASALALLAVGLIALFGALRPGVTGPDQESPTPSATLEATGESTGEAASEPTGTFEPCIAQTVEGTTVYPDYDENGEPLGTLPAGESVQVLAMVYVAGSDPWLEIEFEGETGYILSTGIPADGGCGTIPTVIVDSEPTATPTETPQTPPTATPSAMPPDAACEVAPAGNAIGDLNVYAGPSTTYPIIGALGAGQYVPATGVYGPTNYDLWVRVSYGGGEGWVRGLDYMFIGEGCWPLPEVALQNPPPTWTVMPYTPMPTSTLPPDMDINRVVYLGGDVGWTDYLSGDLPDARGSTTATIAIRVNVPYGQVRMIEVQVQCAGASSSSLRWGYYGSAPEWECGRSIQSGVSQGGNLIVIALSIPNDGTTGVQYTVTATVISTP
jgi:hypothetical protein